MRDAGYKEFGSGNAEVGKIGQKTLTFIFRIPHSNFRLHCPLSSVLKRPYLLPHEYRVGHGKAYDRDGDQGNDIGYHNQNTLTQRQRSGEA